MKLGFGFGFGLKFVRVGFRVEVGVQDAGLGLGSVLVSGLLCGHLVKNSESFAITRRKNIDSAAAASWASESPSTSVAFDPLEPAASLAASPPSPPASPSLALEVEVELELEPEVGRVGVASVDGRFVDVAVPIPMPKGSAGMSIVYSEIRRRPPRVRVKVRVEVRAGAELGES